MRGFKILVLFAFAITISISSCSDKQNEVVVYTTVDQIFSEPILKDFEKETGIKVKAVFDTEETKSTGVLNRLLAEKENTRCDVFWSGDPVRTMVLVNKNMTEPYISPNSNEINEVYKDSQGHWTGFSARARVLIYNKDLLPDTLVPKSIFDLTKKYLKGKVTIANPLFGTTTFHVAALFTTLGDEKAKEFLNNLKNNEVVIAASNGDVKKRVVKGTSACGLTDTDDAFEAIKDGANIGIVFLDQDSLGTLVMPNTVNLMKNAPNSENGKKLIDYLLSKQTEEKLAVSCAQMPLHKDVKTPKNIPSLDNIKPMKVDYAKTAEKLEFIQSYIKEWVEK